MRRVIRGDRKEAAAVAVLLLATAALYLWQLGRSGYANDYYAATVLAGTHSAKAWFFGSLDAANLITVDKPPGALWLMGLSARLFGFSSWSMLVPQALLGAGSVGLLYAAVRRWSGPVAGLAAGAMLALTPVAVVMFRFNNPDALLVFCLTAGAYAMVRAIESAGTGWLVLAGVAVGAGFLAKMLQAWLVLPAFALAYLIAAPTSLRRRLLQLLAAGAAMVAAGGWWVAVVMFWPASARPWIGGSTTNSVLELALGYNGLGRLLGRSVVAAPGAAAAPRPGEATGTGLLRMFSPGVGEQISWLLPAALLALAAGLVVCRRRPRTDRFRATLLLWGGWLLVTAVVFSYMEGKFHAYYTVALAPPIAALISTVAVRLWRHRDDPRALATLAALIVVSGGWGIVLLARTPGWAPPLRYAVAVLTVIASVALVATRASRAATSVTLVATRASRAATSVTPVPTWPSKAAAALAVAAMLAGSAAYAGVSAATPHTGAEPAAGPASSLSRGTRPQAGLTVSADLAALLRNTTTRWAAASAGAQSAAPLELASGRPVMGIGGFTGTDPVPTLARFQLQVAAGQVAYFVGGGTDAGKGPQGGTAGVGAQISAWVAQTFPASTVGGRTVYRLAAG